MNKVRKRGK